MELYRDYVPYPMDSDMTHMSCNLQIDLSPSTNEIIKCSWACTLAPVANSKRVQVYDAFRFDLVTLNFKCKFFYWNIEDLGGFRHDLRSDHDVFARL